MVRGSATQLESACSKAAIPILRTLFVGMIAGAPMNDAERKTYDTPPMIYPLTQHK